MVLVALVSVCSFNVRRPLPEGTSVLGPFHPVPDLEFLYDLTYQRDGEQVVEQQIFDRIFQIIDEAERFITIDMFLFNGEHGGDRDYLPLSDRLTERLVEKRVRSPNVAITFATDEINTFYGVYEPEHFTELANAGVELVITDLTKLRDSNAMYSAGWRLFLQWFGTGGPAFFPHPLTSRGRRVTARSYLRLFNMKANHRKLIVTDRECLITSANPHDASSYHSNIAWVASGAICTDMARSEHGVADFSGSRLPERVTTPPESEGDETGLRGRFLSEGKIAQAVVEALRSATRGDTVDLAMFYLSDRGVVRALENAASHGALLRLILDPNKDAFGREKGGIPNRQVARELHGSYLTQVRWYDTHGEQFHTKLLLVRRRGEYHVFGGSANFTRRNLRDLNLEADFQVVAMRGHPVAASVAAYFDRLWENDDGEYTVPFERYRDDSWFKVLIYRVQEATGLSSF